MSVLGELRDNIATSLTTDTTVSALSYIPGRIVPPLYLVTSGSPYIESGDTYGTFKVGMNVDVISATAANDTSTEALDVLIEDALVSLVNSGVSVLSTTQPFQLEANNATYLAATISISKTVNL